MRIIVGRSGIRDAYRTGRGRVVMRARAHIEELRGGKSAIIVTELPYGVKKGGDAGVIKKIADLVNDKVLTEISDLADHSDRTGMRIQIELKRDAVPQVALNKLFKHTPLQTTFGVNAVALVNGIPRTLSLLELITHFLDFQREIVTRRSKDELRKRERRAHILEGYLIALDNLDAVIRLIRAAADTDAARTGLMETFDLSELQASAILELRLRALTALERKGVEDEYRDIKERIDELRELLGDESKIDALIKEELLELNTIYGRNDDRRSEIIAAEEELELEDLIAEEDMVIAITQSGYIKRLPVTAYREQRRGGIGVMGMDLKDEDYIEHLFVASTHDYILFFTSVGKVYRLKVHELPLGSRQSKGRAIVNLLPFRQDEKVRAVIQTRAFEEAKYLLFATKKGVVKKTELAAYNTNLKADGIIAIKMREGDELVGVRHCSGDDDVLMVSRNGQAIRFTESDVRAMGRDASGVQGMRLRGDDEVISVAIAADDADLLVVTENGYGKRTRVADYPKKGRGGMGVKTVQLTEARGHLAGARVVKDGYQVMLISTGGTVIRMSVDDIRRMGRSTQGVIVMRLREGELVSSLAPVVESGDDAAVVDGAVEAPRLGRHGCRRRRPSRRRARPRRRSLSRRAVPRRRSEPSLFRLISAENPFPFSNRRVISANEGSGDKRAKEAPDGVLEAGRCARADRHGGAPRQDRAVSRTGLRDRGHLEDATRLLDEQGPDPDQGQEAADLRHAGCRDRDADQAGQGQGPEPRRSDRRGTSLPRQAGRRLVRITEALLRRDPARPG